MILLHDSCSLGYDFRDFEAVLDFIISNPNKRFLIYTDERNIEIFKNSVSSNLVQFEEYPKGSFSEQKLNKLINDNSINYDDFFSFPDLYVKIKNKEKLPSGYFKPNPEPYLNPPKNLIDIYLNILDEIAETYNDNLIVFCIVSGLKPLSDVGITLEEQKLEGSRQTYPFEEIANVLKSVQDFFIQKKIAVIPISAQYGSREIIKPLIKKVSKDTCLRFPIKMLEEIDWSNRPEQQSAFFKAIHKRACDLGVPSVAFGNASTYQHLIIAATGGFHVNAIALDSYEKPPSRDGRPYWQELGNGKLAGLKVFKQDCDNPGNWKCVSEEIKKYLKESILNHL